MEMQDEDALGQAEFWQITLAFVDSLTLKCAVELGIPQIIHAKGQPLTLSEIITSLQAPSPDSSCLSRVMRFLVKKQVFSEEVKVGEAYYRLTRASKWLVRPGASGLAPMLTMLNHPIFLAPWHCFSRCVVERVDAFEKAHGSKLWMYTANNTGANDIFNEAMASDTYKSGFAGLTSLVDVAGGTGTAVSAIVKAHPHISRINFDLPQVVSSAPEHPGVVHVSGDMFISIPHADAVFMKQCKKAIAKKSGKLIIVDVVLRPEDDTSAFSDSRLAYDLVIIAFLLGGKQRTEKEWRALLSQGGFSKCNIISLPTLQSIIEAFSDD
ncbi:hypothetical protein AMTRI_Chr02g219390 [Amborella trichopoda]